ncbi:mkk7 [Sarcoptes scabiei]|nr:mkk7 [Sarcoptes scabiei]
MDETIISHKIHHPLVPDSIYYVPDFISQVEESALIQNVLKSSKFKWKHLNNRSLQIYGGYPKPEGMIVEPLPEWLQFYTLKLKSLNVFEENLANQVLINRYEPGQGIMAHEDGPLYYPTVATINTGSHTVLNFYKKIDPNSNDCSPKYEFSLLLWPRSLSILQNTVYNQYLHEIEELKFDKINFDPESNDQASKKIVNLNLIEQIDSETQCLTRSTRYSFTIRFVPKFHKINLNKFLFK